MKYLESSFVEYVNSVEKYNLHPELSKDFALFPENMKKMPNIIFYGPKGVGKYSQVLHSIKKYSPSKLKYERKMNIQHKKEHVFKISDIHFEIDMELLGCNAKILWNVIYYNILDIISTKKNLTGIIVCKNFHMIHSELLETFYSYMQTLLYRNVHIVFILITESICFIPKSIIHCSHIINVARPSRRVYNKLVKIKKSTNLSKITNIKNLHMDIDLFVDSEKIICNRIINYIVHYKDIPFLKLRDELYNIFICHIDLTDCLWYILHHFIEKRKVNNEDMGEILYKMYTFLKLYNNNYRPIYHLESFILYLCKKINGF